MRPYRSTLTHARWCSNNGMGVPCMCYSRKFTNLRCCPLVLGLNFDQIDNSKLFGLPCLYPRLHHYQHCRLRRRHPHVGSRHRAIHRSPEVLPSIPRQNALVLHVSFPPQNHNLVLRRHRHSELFPIRAIRSQLALPLLIATCPPPTPSSSLSSSSSSSSGPPSSTSSPASPPPTAGSSPSSPSASALHDGRRCSGARPTSGNTSPGLAAQQPVLSWAEVFGSGSAF